MDIHLFPIPGEKITIIHIKCEELDTVIRIRYPGSVHAAQRDLIVNMAHAMFDELDPILNSVYEDLVIENVEKFSSPSLPNREYFVDSDGCSEATDSSDVAHKAKSEVSVV